ncbi:MAG TPA: hypothetical protein VL832_08105 [Puia sp.]|jgi:hypothetical protein|nr:hypothetical protein [Puia sp.]
MRKILLLLILVIVIKTHARCQAFATKIDYQKTQQSAAGIQLAYESGSVEDAVKEYMTKKGYKSASSKGFIVFRAATLDSTDTEGSDLYFTVARKSRKEKDITLITLLPTKKQEDILARAQTDDPRIEKAKSFLDNMAPFIDAYEVQLQLNSQTEVVKKAEKKLNSLLSDENDLNKKIRRLQDDSAQNKKDQVKVAADLQSNVNSDDATKTKNHKKLSKLLDNEGDLAKKLRNTRSDLDQNKKDQEAQRQELDKQKQSFDAIKARQK